MRPTQESQQAHSSADGMVIAMTSGIDQDQVMKIREPHSAITSGNLFLLGPPPREKKERTHYMNSKPKNNSKFFTTKPTKFATHLHLFIIIY